MNAQERINKIREALGYSAQDRINEIKEELGYEDYTLFTIPISNGNGTYSTFNVTYKVPAGYVLVHKDHVKLQDEELINFKSFTYQSRNRYNRFKKFIKSLTEKGE